MIERKRTTHETDISLKLRLKGAGRVDVTTGHGFFDHMLHQLAYHAGMDLNLKAIGDQTGDHHLVEDVAICLGDAFQEGWRNQNGLNRFGHTILPMDDALVMCATDLCGRAYCEVDLKLTRETVGGLDTEMVPHFFRSFSSASMINLHLKTLSGTNHHHVIEAAFKATARALRQALSQDMITFSTKGAL
ncbi:MAG: imidazoleglycerol-phosphate dehydratase HisB [Acidobacteria bacterium]|nr:imidazoleglycerol-phosphate dehydratase HisB [Acidobacteriota bacterium]